MTPTPQDERLRNALQELVRLKKLKDKLDRGPHNGWYVFGEQRSWTEAKAEYDLAKPIAWAEAEAALSALDARDSQSSLGDPAQALWNKGGVTTDGGYFWLLYPQWDEPQISERHPGYIFDDETLWFGPLQSPRAALSQGPVTPTLQEASEVWIVVKEHVWEHGDGERPTLAYLWPSEFNRQVFPSFDAAHEFIAAGEWPIGWVAMKLPVEALAAPLDAQDALRYRWLRDPDRCVDDDLDLIVGQSGGEDVFWREQLDKAIDNARRLNRIADPDFGAALSQGAAK